MIKKEPSELSEVVAKRRKDREQEACTEAQASSIISFPFQFFF